ncbi:MAG: 6-bladed beta-propeller, partial [Nitritalea sp.]
MKISQYFASLICICLTQIHVSCNGQEASSFTGNESTDVVKIIVRSKDIQESFTVTPEKVSEHFVVPLETTDASLIGKLDKAIRHEDKIFVLDSDLAKTVFCFDLDGKFLFKLGRLGKGPGEYRELRDIVLYPSTNEIGVLDGDKIIWYNTGDGSFTGAATELKNIMLD